MKTLLILAALVLPLLVHAQDGGNSEGYLSTYYPTLSPSQAPADKDDTPEAYFNIQDYPACQPVNDAASLITFYAPEYKKAARGFEWVQSLRDAHPLAPDDANVVPLKKYVATMRDCLQKVKSEKWSSEGPTRKHINILLNALSDNLKDIDAIDIAMAKSRAGN